MEWDTRVLLHVTVKGICKRPRLTTLIDSPPLAQELTISAWSFFSLVNAIKMTGAFSMQYLPCWMSAASVRVPGFEKGAGWPVSSDMFGIATANAVPSTGSNGCIGTLNATQTRHAPPTVI
jgi:hypothetical protein